jgi:TonB family protein
MGTYGNFWGSYRLRPTQLNGTGKKELGNGMSSYGNCLFTSVETPQMKTRWESFAVSYMLQAAGVTTLIVATILAPKIAPPALMSHIELVAPNLTPLPKAPPPPVRAVVRPVAPAVTRQVVKPEPLLASVQLPKIPAPPPQIQPVQRPQRLQTVAPVAVVELPKVAPSPKFDSNVLNALPGPKAPAKIVATNTFGGSSATPTLPSNTPASKVQTGGFGDPNGVPVNAHGSDHANIAAAGSFELPPGGGYGNGSGGTHGLRGTVASAGFGNGIAVQGGGGRGGNAAQGQPHLQAASFGNNAAAATTTGSTDARTARPLNQAPTSYPVSIQSKPTPVYTSEAREMKVEGEVLLNVVFTSDGKIQVLNVVRGLGHGLDEAAQRAAQGIRFTPAMRDGRPIDSNVTLHIVFQLS